MLHGADEPNGLCLEAELIPMDLLFYKWHLSCKNQILSSLLIKLIIQQLFVWSYPIMTYLWAGLVLSILK